ncbi:hypothetical protein N431DRAFT_437675 [Stipitochalara longipes BDJ]|nr:hypothetical protein N431DRAFT_437675 [Stipitochalara longipes BDJ]
MADIHSVPVAKACNNCARAKAKCDAASGGKCARCIRLGKECAPQKAVRKRKAPRIRRSEQIAQLQETVNGLLSIVGSGQQLLPEQAAAFMPSPASLASSSYSRSAPSVDNGSTQFVHLPVTHEPFQNTVVTVPSSSIIPESVPFLKNSDVLLNIFRDRLAAYIPFIIIPSHLRAEDLHRDKPMVYMSIMLAASYADMTTQQELGKLILKYLATKAILEGKKSLDILEGLLIYIYWYQYLCHINVQTNNLMGLLSAQLVDLGLKRVSAENEVHESFIQIARRVQAHGLPDCCQGNCGKPLTRDEKRSYLGCYYLSSCLSASTSRLDCLRFPPYIKECCDDLTEAAEHPNDIQLAYLMRLQILVEKQRVGGLWQSVNASQHEALRAPIGLLVRSYQLELQDFKASLPTGYLSSRLLSMNYYAAEIGLYEVGFKLVSTTGVVYHDGESLRLSDILYACFQATRSWFDSYLSIPIADSFTLSLIAFGQLFHSIGALYKLSVFDIPEWDIAVVRETLNLSNLLGQLALRLEEAGDLYSEEVKPQNNAWKFCAAKLRNCKIWWDKTVAQETEAPAGVEVWPEGFNEELLPFMNFESLDDYFWQSMV